MLTGLLLAVGLNVGQMAPDFVLPSDRGGNVRLSEFKGKKNVVLAFYPKDETPGCTQEMKAFQKDVAQFEKTNTQILGVSVDDVDSHLKFRISCALTFPLLSDKGGLVAKRYGATMVPFPMAKRKLFVIDKNGKIREVVDGMPDNAKLLKLLQQI